mmetsp:Transcript_21393/g.46838  ORF Transcript_21393/g.46838 Transcript_21393/m.46838 type:complete len:251 (-) Transcript_21393:373-1125(-)
MRHTTSPLLFSTAFRRACPPSSRMSLLSRATAARLVLVLMPVASALAPSVVIWLPHRSTSTKPWLVLKVVPMAMAPGSCSPHQASPSTCRVRLGRRPSAICATPLGRSLFHDRLRSVRQMLTCSMLPSAIAAFSPSSLLDMSRVLREELFSIALATPTVSLSLSFIRLRFTLLRMLPLVASRLARALQPGDASLLPERSSSVMSLLSSRQSARQRMPSSGMLLLVRRRIVIIWLILSASTRASVPLRPKP